MSKCRIIIFLLASLTCLASSLPAVAGEADARQDTLSFRILFRSGKSSSIDLGYEGNGYQLNVFERELNRIYSDGGKVVSVSVIASSSPDGSHATNLRLSGERGEAMVSYLKGRFGFEDYLISLQSVGEDWEGLEEIVSGLDKPWRQDVLDILSDGMKEAPEVRFYGLKSRLKALDGGKVWNELIAEVFPLLRAAGCTAHVVVEIPEKKTEDVKDVKEAGGSSVIRDTVYIEVPVGAVAAEPVEKIVYVSGKRPAKPYDLEGKKMIFAPRTNFIMGPLMNVGLEVPIGKHFSVGADWYCPWVWRPRHSENIDTRGWCVEFLAGDVEFRYWFGDRNAKPEQRLLGFSIGAYFAAGYFDFERNWFGYQGDFWNAGVDFLYAIPLWGGRMHMEFELGIGYIHSLATPYECLEPGGDCFRVMTTRRLVRWIGPTRAQVSLVVPIYVKSRKGGAK